jgi:hypothetical protein
MIVKMKYFSILHKVVTYSLIFALANFSISCVSYRPSIIPKDQSIRVDPNKNYYLIIERSWGSSTLVKRDWWQMRELSIDNNSISCHLDPIFLDNPQISFSGSIPKQGSQNINLFLSRDYDVWSEQTESGKVLIPFTAIDQVEVYDIDLAKTIVYSTLGVAGTLGVLVILILLTKSSCPFIYAYNGESYEFVGEIYSGAIHPPLERHDYLPLPVLQPIENEYRIKITNEIKEIQHTNLTELLVFDHPENAEILVDKYGNVHTIFDPQLPEISKALDGSNIDSLLSSKDSLVYMSGIPDNENQDMDAVILTFDRPVDRDTGKLVIKGKNSFWLDYIHGQFSELFGDRFETWKEEQKEKSPEKMIEWSLDQGIPLSVYLETDEGWEFVDYYNVVGPLASKDDVLEIDLTSAKNDKVNIKLEFGFLFWEIDYAAMDFTPNLTTSNYTVPVTSAMDQNSIDVSYELQYDDEKYYHQPHIGDQALLTFDVPEQIEGTKRSVVLHSKGYYEILKDAKGEPDLAYLNSFRKPGAFSKFSKERFMQFYNQFQK